MPIRRRLLLAAAPLLLGRGLLLGRRALAQQADPRMAERSFGRPDARLVVQEWFSLTCTHCAHFSDAVFPEVQAKLIDTGRIRYVFRDFPLDQLALAAAGLSRALPPDRYLPFVETLLATQDAWAFRPDADPLAALTRQATLAGLSAAAVQATLADDGLRREIVAEQDGGQKRFDIKGTPTFVFGNSVVGPIASYADFAGAVDKAIAAG